MMVTTKPFCFSCGIEHGDTPILFAGKHGRVCGPCVRRMHELLGVYEQVRRDAPPDDAKYDLTFFDEEPGT
jgi:hypothetical protein